MVAAATPAIYIATAYLWGETNNHWYHVYAGIDRTKAMALAQVEQNDRARYAVAVWEFTPDGCDYKLIGYFPSTAEADDACEPRHSHIIDYYKRLGFFLHEATQGKCLQPDAEDPKRMTYQECEIPEYQRRKVEHEQGILRALADNERTTGVKQGPQT